MHVSMMETYDLSTAVGKMGLIAIRTPNLQYIDKKWPGFVRNFKYVRVNSANVQVACAQMLPADPLQVGFEPGQVAPQDMFNPILYRTVSNDSWNGLVNRIYAFASGNSLSGSVAGIQNMDAFPSAPSGQSTNVYYTLLSENGWRKAHPQQGLSVRNVRPLVWTLLHTLGAPLQGSAQLSAPGSDAIGISNAGTEGATIQGAGSYLKGHAQPMPRVPTVISVSDTVDNGLVPLLGYIPTCYCLAIVTPPATQSLMYFRLVVVWDIEFIEPRSDAELGLLRTVNGIAPWVHYENQAPQPIPDSKNNTIPGADITAISDTAVQVDEGRSVVADGVSLDLVMEK